MDPVWQRGCGGVLYVGGRKALEDRGLLGRTRVECIVNCTDNLFMEQSERAVRFAVALRHHVTTDRAAVDFFEEACCFIEAALRNDRNVLVRCTAGAHRAAVVATGFLVARGGLSLSQAIAAVKNGRPVAAPEAFLPLLESLANGASLAAADGSAMNHGNEQDAAPGGDRGPWQSGVTPVSLDTEEEVSTEEEA